MNKNQNTNESKEDITFDVRPSTVFYEQWYKTINGLPLKERDKAYKYIFEYAFYGIEPEGQDKDKTSVAYVVFGMAKPNVDSAQKRYDEAIENGQKGGRPKKVTELVRTNIIELRKNGLTQKQVASELGLSLKTIQRVEKDISQNHNVNVNVNDNVNDNVNVNSVASDAAYTNQAPPKDNNSFITPDGVATKEKRSFSDISDQECQEMFDKYNSGQTMEELMEEYNAPRDVVNSALKYILLP